MNAKVRFILAVGILLLLMTGPFLMTAGIVYSDLNDEQRVVFMQALDRWMPVGGLLTIVGLFAVAAAASIVAALTIGTFPISLLQLVETLFIPIPGVVRDVVWELRVPRAAAAFGCGALLALAGALLQVLLRNPLADS